MAKINIGILFVIAFCVLATPEANAQYCGPGMPANLSLHEYVKTCETTIRHEYKINHHRMSFRRYLQFLYESYQRSSGSVPTAKYYAPGGCRDRERSCQGNSWLVCRGGQFVNTGKKWIPSRGFRLYCR